MATRKDGSAQNLNEGRNSDLSRGGLSSDSDQVNDEENLDTTTVSSDIEEGDEDYDDEDELDEDDFDVDEDDVEEVSDDTETDEEEVR